MQGFVEYSLPLSSMLVCLLSTLSRVIYINPHMTAGTVSTVKSTKMSKSWMMSTTAQYTSDHASIEQRYTGAILKTTTMHEISSISLVLFNIC